MMTISWTQEADACLEVIAEFLEEHNPSVLNEKLQGIIEAAEILKQFPHRGHQLYDSPKFDILILHYDNYKLAYRITSKNQINIVAVAHDKMDLRKLLGH